MERSWRGDEGSLNGKIIRIIIGSEIALTCENSTSSANFPASPPRVCALRLSTRGQYTHTQGITVADFRVRSCGARTSMAHGGLEWPCVCDKQLKLCMQKSWHVGYLYHDRSTRFAGLVVRIGRAVGA